MTTRRQFRIERLEERVAPNCLWQSVLVEAIVGVGSLHARLPAEQARLAATKRIQIAAENAASLATQTMFPAWAETLLIQIESELDRNPASAGEPAPVAQHRHSARLDELMLQVDEGLRNAARSVGQPAAVDTETMPSWAEDLLLEIQQEVAQTQGNRRPRPAMAGAPR